MTLFDSNIIIDARSERSNFGARSLVLIERAVAGGGAAVNAVVFAELVVGQPSGHRVETELRSAGIDILDLPAAAAPICGRAYTRYLRARQASGGGEAPRVPLPDFFIGAHAELMGWRLATRDSERFRLYFPSVELIQP